MGIVRPDGGCTHRHVLQFQKAYMDVRYSHGVRNCYTDTKEFYLFVLLKCAESNLSHEKRLL